MRSSRLCARRSGTPDTRSRAHRPGMAGVGAIAPAMAGRAQVRAALDDPARDAHPRRIVLVSARPPRGFCGMQQAFGGIDRMARGVKVLGPFPDSADHAVDAVAVRGQGRHGRGALAAVRGQVLVGKGARRPAPVRRPGQIRHSPGRFCGATDEGLPKGRARDHGSVVAGKLGSSADARPHGRHRRRFAAPAGMMTTSPFWMLRCATRWSAKCRTSPMLPFRIDTSRH